MNRADVVVGIPSWNNAGTIGHVVDCAVRGLATDFGELDALVLNSDGSSADGTAAVVFDAGQRAIDDAAAVGHRGIAVESILYRGIPGKGSAFRSIFEESVRRGARAVVVLDADLRSVTPDWIARLARPVLDGRADYVTPLYRRHKFDGTITNSIVYPLTTSLFGGRIRQPIGGDFGFSGNLAGLFLSKEVWEGDVARFGVDLWMTTTALAEGFRVGQAHLGAKIHDPKDPGSHLAAMMAQVVGTAFALMETYEERWRIQPPAPPAPEFGAPEEVPTETVVVDPGRMENAFRLAVRDLAPLYESILPRSLLGRLGRLAASPPPFSFDDELWAATVAAFALAFHRRRLPREQLLRSLTPLYLGRTGSFVRAHETSDHAEVEKALDRLRIAFADATPRLARLWTSPTNDGEEDSS